MTTRNNLSRRKFLKIRGATTAGAIAANVSNPSSIAIAASGDRADSAKALSIGGVIFYPEIYGAHADEYPNEESSNPSATDNTAAIQAAIDAAYNAGGGTVQLGSGTYKIKRAPGTMHCLEIKEGVILQGNGIDVTRLKLADNQFRIAANPLTYEYLFIIESIQWINSIQIKNLTVMGQRA